MKIGSKILSYGRKPSGHCLWDTWYVVVGPPRLVAESYQRRRVLRAGVNLRLTCPVESPPPPPLVAWTKDGQTVHLGWERYRVHGDVLRVRDVHVDDSGVYVCRATNGFGTIDVKYLVYVYGICRHRACQLFSEWVELQPKLAPATAWSASGWPVVGTRRSDRRCQSITTMVVTL